MQKFDLSSLESKNMTAASDELLAEVNGGCDFQKGWWVSSCGGSWYGWNRKGMGCGNYCPLTIIWDWEASGHNSYNRKFVRLEKRGGYDWCPNGYSLMYGTSFSNLSHTDVMSYDRGIKKWVKQ